MPVLRSSAALRAAKICRIGNLGNRRRHYRRRRHHQYVQLRQAAHPWPHQPRALAHHVDIVGRGNGAAALDAHADIRIDIGGAPRAADRDGRAQASGGSTPPLVIDRAPYRRTATRFMADAHAGACRAARLPRQMPRTTVSSSRSSGSPSAMPKRRPASAIGSSGTKRSARPSSRRPWRNRLRSCDRTDRIERLAQRKGAIGRDALPARLEPDQAA